jgi:hypothetical protein
LFRAAVKALTRQDDEPKPAPRRKSGETEKGFGMAARAIMRRAVQIPAALYEAATDYLSDTLDLLNRWNDEDLTADFDDDFANDHNDNSLNL